VIRRLGVRARLTVLVTAVFAIATTLGAIAVVRIVQDRLVDDTRANAERILSEYLARIYGGTPAAPTVQPEQGTSFFFLDERGREMSEREYWLAILDDPFVQAIPTSDVLTAAPTEAFDDPLVVTAGSERGLAVSVEPSTGVFVGADGATMTYRLAPRAVDDSSAVDRGDDLVAVAQTFEMPNGRRVQVGVSMPLLAVSDGLDAVRTVLWFAVPALTAAVAAITWLVAGRALRPVHAITARSQAISASNLSERVPVPVARDEIHELATTVNDMLARLDESHRQQRQFVADASHELRSPVAASRVQLEVGLADPDATDWPATASAVLAEQRQLGRLVDDLLALGRLDEGGIAATADVDLDDVLTRETARPQPVPIVVDRCDPVRLVGNEQLLTRLVRNLIDNGARHAATDVHVTLRRNGHVATLDVDDNGPGVPPADRDRIFQRFTRVDEARGRHDGGAGLGLAIAREVARAHGGEVRCDDAPSGGARFTVTLPVAAVEG
jgi:signal transduction histidine kinase